MIAKSILKIRYHIVMAVLSHKRENSARKAREALLNEQFAEYSKWKALNAYYSKMMDTEADVYELLFNKES